MTGDFAARLYGGWKVPELKKGNPHDRLATIEESKGASR
jgi:hypothetical protein